MCSQPESIMGERKKLDRTEGATTTKRQHVNCTESTAQADENVYVHTFNLATGRPKITPQDDQTKVQAKASAQDFEKARLGPSMGLPHRIQYSEGTRSEVEVHAHGRPQEWHAHGSRHNPAECSVSKEGAVK
jgi:hypothetical protein